jgi:hypothetical protein
VVSDYAPHSIEEMKTIVESAGGNWEELLTPPQLVYPTLQEALAHKMPNGKYKDQTMQQIWDADKSPRGMINFLATKSDRISPEKAAAQVILVRLGGANIPGVPTADGQPATASKQQTAQASTSVQDTTSQQTAQNTVPVSSDRQEMIKKINTIFSTAEKFKTGGFNLIIAEMKKYGNGKTNITDFTDAELSALLESCEE